MVVEADKNIYVKIYHASEKVSINFISARDQGQVHSYAKIVRRKLQHLDIATHEIWDCFLK